MAAKSISTKPLRIAISGGPTPESRRCSTGFSAGPSLDRHPNPASPATAIGMDTTWQNRRIKMFDTAGLRDALGSRKFEKLAVADALGRRNSPRS